MSRVFPSVLKPRERVTPVIKDLGGPEEQGIIFLSRVWKRCGGPSAGVSAYTSGPRIIVIETGTRLKIGLCLEKDPTVRDPVSCPDTKTPILGGNLVLLGMPDLKKPDQPT